MEQSPPNIQRNLFDDTASMSDPEQRFRLKQQIARLSMNIRVAHIEIGHL